MALFPSTAASRIWGTLTRTCLEKLDLAQSSKETSTGAVLIKKAVSSVTTQTWMYSAWTFRKVTSWTTFEFVPDRAFSSSSSVSMNDLIEKMRVWRKVVEHWPTILPTP